MFCDMGCYQVMFGMSTQRHQYYAQMQALCAQNMMNRYAPVESEQSRLNMAHWEEMTELLLTLPLPAPELPAAPPPPEKKGFWKKWF